MSREIPGIFKGRTAAVVWPAMPIRHEFLIPGRWPQPKALRQGVNAVVSGKLPILESMNKHGQRKAVTARFEIHPKDDHRWATQWPHLNLALHPQVGVSADSVVDVLARHLLIYEGNHRWAISRMLCWDYVLVEPQLWDFTGVDDVEQRVMIHQLGVLGRMVPPGFKIGQWRFAKPKRSDLRPLNPEFPTPEFRGDKPGKWRPK